MANEEHLKILRQGVEVWNKWRLQNPDIQPDLSDADLKEEDISRRDLRRVIFSGADLREADVRFSKLSFAYLDGVDLRGACLRGTVLRSVDLRGAYLSGADLSKADVGYSILGDIDLSAVKGLDTVKHIGPSTIGIDTIYRSKGKIPEAFLRGAGVPDSFIEYMASLVGKPFEFYSCFISYSSKDKEFCNRLYSRMRDEHLRVWFAPEDIAGGRKLYDQIDQAIRIHDKLLVILSEHSLRSEWVMMEIRRARQAEIREGRRKLFPIRLVDMEAIRDWTCFDADTGKDLAVEVREYFIPDFSNWKNHDEFEKAFERLLRDLKAEDVVKADT